MYFNIRSYKVSVVCEVENVTISNGNLRKNYYNQ